MQSSESSLECLHWAGSLAFKLQSLGTLCPSPILSSPTALGWEACYAQLWLLAFAIAKCPLP